MKYIGDAKYFEGLKISADPGDAFVISFIQSSAACLREKWNKSVCQDCKNWKCCGNLLKECCEQFTEDE